MRKPGYIAAFIILAGEISGQTYNFREFTTAEGLPQNYVYCISQDSNGNLICSTGEALSRFNGYDFETISPDKLAINFIATHLVDSRDHIWLGHNQGGVSLLMGKQHKRFITEPLVSSKVIAIAEGDSGTAVVAAMGAGLFRLDSSGKCSKVKNVPEMIASLFRAGRDSFLAGVEEGLVLIKLRQNRATIVPIKGLEGDSPRQIARAFHKKDCYWLLTQQNDIYELRKRGGEFVISHKLPGEILGENVPTCIYGGSAGGLWIGLTGSGVMRITIGAEFPLAPVSSQTINTQNGLKAAQIQTIFEDREGNFWFGTFGEGLVQKPADKFIYYGLKEGITDVNISAVLASGPDAVWIGNSTGLHYYDRIKHLVVSYSSKKGFVQDKVTALAYGPGNELWIGTEKKGLFALDTLRRSFRPVLYPRGLSPFSELHDVAVKCIARSRNKMFAGTAEGLYIFNTKEGGVEMLTTNEGLLHNNVLHVHADEEDRIWISSHGSPPYYINRGKATPFRKIEGLSTYNINAVSEDRQGTIWIATEGDGVFSFNGSKFRNYTTTEGLLSDFCSGLAVDQYNTLWVTHKSGLSEKPADKTAFISYSTKQGLIFSQNNPNAVATDNTGRVWFGTTNGLVYLAPKGRAAEMTPPRIFFTGLLVNESLADHSGPVKLKYDNYSLQISFLAICLSDPSAIFYKYRLADSDSSWTVTEARSVTYPKLSDGVYNFEVMACNRTSGLSSAPARLTVNIEPPAWKTAWFYLLLFASVAAVTYGIVYLRTMRLRRAQLLLQLKIKQKTFLLQREKQVVESIKIELENKNKDITDSINYAKRIQDSILPPEEVLSELFGEDYFVLFKPKDIVSGDFYWASKLNVNVSRKKPLSLAAVIDCTGHGVPGAFLSIMANDFLKEALQTKEVNTTNQILNFINSNVSSHLNQTSKSQVRDGMDIALIGIDRAANKLFFSGANNPIYVYRPGPKGVDQIILTATKQAIGLVSEDTLPFSFREIELIKGDTIYLFSDGYADQFGGPNNKKIGYKRFREVLLSGFNKPMPAQKQLLDDYFKAWKGDGEQIDDVCIMGIRI